MKRDLSSPPYISAGRLEFVFLNFAFGILPLRSSPNSGQMSCQLQKDPSTYDALAAPILSTDIMYVACMIESERGRSIGG